jgi:exonuclease VII large subunit
VRIFATALLMSTLAMPALAGAVPAAEAASHVGQSVTVEGTVSEVHTARSGKATFIDIGGSYPNEAFTAVIFERSMSSVGDVSGLAGKTVDVTGTIQVYEGRPEIVVSSRDQIRVR